jgi:two-component system OmpR family sensor kinase
MKRVLFWKIYLGFGVTFLFIVDGLWLLFNVLHPLPSETTRALARISLAAASTMIQRGGAPELNAMLANWPLDERGRLIVEPWGKQSVLQGDINSGAVSIRAHDPQGKQYLITYAVRRHLGYGRGPFDIPPEIVMLAMLGGLIFSGLLAWNLTNPIHRISQGFSQLANADFSARLAPTMKHRKDELAELTRGFDKLAEHLQELVAARDRLISDVSHELRTPLTRLQLAIGLARQAPDKLEASLARISREASYLDDLVGELLTLSKLESGKPSDGEYFDLQAILRSIVEDASFEAGPRGIAICGEAACEEREWIVAGSGKLVHRAIENVLRNAIRFSRRGQQVDLALVARGEREFMVTVVDSGPGVPEQFLPSFFEPFAKRSLTDEQGIGLGLSIAKRAIIANHGTIRAQNRPAGGLAITITLPAADHPAGTPGV